MTPTPTLAAAERTLSQLQEFATPRVRDTRMFRDRKTGDLWPYHPGLEDDDSFELLAEYDARAIVSAAKPSAAPMSVRPSTANLVLRRKVDKTLWPYDPNLAADAGFELLELHPPAPAAAPAPIPVAAAPVAAAPVAAAPVAADLSPSLPPARRSKFSAPPVKAKPSEDADYAQSSTSSADLSDLE